MDNIDLTKITDPELLLGQLDQILAQMVPNLMDWATSFVTAIIVLIIGAWLARSLARMVNKALSKLPQLDDTLKTFLPALMRYIIYAVTFIVVLGQLGVQTASIIAVLGAAGLAIGLALQGTLQNIAAGLMLLILRPFQVGDYIEAGSLTGTVKAVGLFTSDLQSAQGHYISVPNSNLWNVSIINFSRNPAARIDVDIGISYDDDMEVGLATLAQLADEMPFVKKSPSPQTYIVNLADSAVVLRLRCWVDAGEQWVGPFEIYREGRKRLEAEGCTIPFPQQDIHVYHHGEDESAPKGEASYLLPQKGKKSAAKAKPPKAPAKTITNSKNKVDE